MICKYCGLEIPPDEEAIYNISGKYAYHARCERMAREQLEGENRKPSRKRGGIKRPRKKRWYER